MGKLDIILFPLVLFFRVSLALASLVNSILKSKWCQGVYNLLFNDPHMWLAKEALHTTQWTATQALNAITYASMTLIHWAYMVVQFNISCCQLWYAILTFWPKFYWNILKPEKGKRSLFQMLTNPHSRCKTWWCWSSSPPDSKRQQRRKIQARQKIRPLWARLNVWSQY